MPARGYCYCGGDGLGAMVACDNSDCPKLWFHLACCGLDEPPGEGEEWFCSASCRAQSCTQAYPPPAKKAKTGKPGRPRKVAAPSPPLADVTNDVIIIDG